MSLSISSESFPHGLNAIIFDYLDARSKDSVSKTCKRFRAIIENTGISLSVLGFASYLTNELFTAGFYNRALASRNATESETFKSRIGNMWFGGLNEKKEIPGLLLTCAIRDLSAKRQWSDAKIKKLCKMLNYEATKEMPNVPYSWKVTLKS